MMIQTLIRGLRCPILGLLVCALAIAAATPAVGQASIDLPAAVTVASALRPRFDGYFRLHLPGASPAQIDKAERAFAAHLRETSGLDAEQLASGRIDLDDLASRIEVFLADHPEFASAASGAPTTGPRTRIVDALRKYPDLGASDHDREALADRFVVWLGNLSGSARETLLAGRMTPEELQSRIDVYIGDVRAERSRVVQDPAVAAVPAIADAFEKANLGPVTERADSISCHGTVTEKGATRNFIMFKKRPGSVRIQVVQGDIVIGVLAYDGAEAWSQTPGHRAENLRGQAAATLIASARFDDPIVGYRERGAVARLESAPGASPLRISIRELDGTEVKEAIDPSNYQELSQTRRDAAGHLEENRFSDYKKSGNLNYPGVQELWIDGALYSTTRLGEIQLDPGILARFFVMPKDSKLDFMDFMGGLAIIENMAKKHAEHSDGIVLPTGASK